jgi:squalene-hopene/tetraprenyl-beta-curcumene cyclase
MVMSRLGRWAVGITALGLAFAATGADEAPRKPSANSPAEPIAPAYSPARAAEFLDGVSLAWTKERKCGTCHTNYNYMIARPALGVGQSKAMVEVREFFEGRVAHWDDDQPKAKPQFDAEVVATAAALALNDSATTGRLHPLTRKALDRMWGLQREDGAWDWLDCKLPPYEHDDYYGATFAAVGVGQAPDGYRETETAREGLEDLRRYFRETPPPSLHHRTMLLWASTRIDGLMTPGQKDETTRTLLDLQRPDGGWNLPSLGDWKRRDGTPNDKGAPSDGFGTGFVVYVLRQAGLPSDHPKLRDGVAWLKANQRESGRWFTRSVNNDKAHYIANAGSGFAVMAIRACEGALPAPELSGGRPSR